MGKTRDHGGNLDAQIARFGGDKADWLDLSTGINPVPYPTGTPSDASWAVLPDQAAQEGLVAAARSFWQVPDDLDILAAPGASALIARLPALFSTRAIDIPQPTYNEHAAAFEAHGYDVTKTAELRVLVHPNNPTGRFWQVSDLSSDTTIIDESFCDIAPENSLLAAAQDGHIILKSFGKFWGLAGLRIGFMIARPDRIARMRELIGPWAVSGPALEIGRAALLDHDWAATTRQRLAADAKRLDALMADKGIALEGGCDLFRLYRVPDAAQWQEALAQNHVWSRIFPYSKTFLRLGLPAPDQWDQLEAALSRVNP